MDHLTQVQLRLKLATRCEIGLRAYSDSLSLQFPAISFLNEWLLYLTQTVLCCKYAVDSRRDLDSKRSSCILTCVDLWWRLRVSQAMSIVRRKLQHAAHLLRSHMIEWRMIRQKTQTTNAIFSHYNSLLLHNDLLPCETEALDPGSTQVRRPGLNQLYIGPCEKVIIGLFDCI